MSLDALAEPKEHWRQRVSEAIAADAAGAGGTTEDLDPDLEVAAIEVLYREAER